jgi:hypothetical protein
MWSICPRYSDVSLDDRHYLKFLATGMWEKTLFRHGNGNEGKILWEWVPMGTFRYSIIIF